jgi:hypothetical protein
MLSKNIYCSIALSVCLSVLAACGSAPSLDDVPTSEVNLIGTWVLDRSQSTDVRAKLRSIISRRERDLNYTIQKAEKEGVIDEPVGPPLESAKSGAERRQPRPGEDDASTITWIRRQQRLEYEAVIAFLSPPSQLTIEKRNREYRVLSDKGEGTRRFTPGEPSSVFNAFGAFEVESGWDKSSFVVSSVGQGDNDMQLLERYSLMEDGAALHAVVVARLPSLGKHEFRFVFRRR